MELLNLKHNLNDQQIYIKCQHLQIITPSLTNSKGKHKNLPIIKKLINLINQLIIVPNNLLLLTVTNQIFLKNK